MNQRIDITSLIILTVISTPFTSNLTRQLPVSAAPSQLAALPASEICQIRSQSMLPTVKINGHVVVNRLAYSSQLPKHGDIIVFKPTRTMQRNLFPTNLHNLYMKRVIGLPGETVKVIDKKVYINNKPLKEKYINEKPIYLLAPVVIPKNSYFVLGDNRNDSYDSHRWGLLPQKLISGQVVKIVGQRSQLGQTQAKPALVNPSSSGCQLY